MKNIKLIIPCVIILLTGIVCVAPVMTGSLEPPAGTTGAPGEGSCADAGCHGNGAPVFDPSKITIKLHPVNPVLASPLDTSFRYLPDTTYKALLQIDFINNLKYGFQLVVLDSNMQSAGTLVSINSFTGIQTGTGGRQYINHRNASTNPSWSFWWETPPTSAGPLTVYACVVRGNPDSVANMQDHVFRTAITIKPAMVPQDSIPDTTSTTISSINEHKDLIEVKGTGINRMMIRINTGGDSGWLTVYDINGRQIYHETVIGNRTWQPFPAKGAIDAPGFYIIRYQNRILTAVTKQYIVP